MKNSKTVLMMFLVAVAPLVWAGEHVTYFHNDALGSPVAATNAVGEVLWTEVYEPYGTRVNKPSDPNRLWYTGKAEEIEFGLNYFGARWYEPTTGRFHGIDPAGFRESDVKSFNRYEYANGNPYAYIDPDGRRIVFAAGSSDTFKANFALAVRYLSQHKAAGDLAKLEKSSATYTIRYEERGGTFSPYDRTIGWDPNLGAITTNDKRLSPSTILGHEAAHAAGYDSNPDRYFADRRTDSGDDYDNIEEKRVITGPEQDIARQLGEIGDGEITRADHRGHGYPVAGPTSTPE